MTEHSFEYKTLRFLNDRFELYNITDHSLKIALFDFTENDYLQGIDSLRNAGFIKNKDLYDQGLSITTQGQIRLQQLQKSVELEKKQSKTFWERTAPIRDTIGIVGTIFAIIFGWLTISDNKENSTLKTQNKALVDSVSTHLKETKVWNDSISAYIIENKNLRDSISSSFTRENESTKTDSITSTIKR